MATLQSIESELRELALAYPGAVEDFPWGDHCFKVKKKIFLFLGVREKQLGVTVKLPESNQMALSLPFCQPTGYGLGKSGWVSARFERAAEVPVPMLVEWMDESYRAIAPKTLLKELDGRAAGESAPKQAPPDKAPKKRAAPVKAASAKKPRAKKK